MCKNLIPHAPYNEHPKMPTQASPFLSPTMQNQISVFYNEKQCLILYPPMVLRPTSNPHELTLS